MKIGILGGTFNPPHNCHKNLILNLLDKKLVDKVIILATNNKYNKREIINLKDRINMLQLTMKDKRIIVENEDICKKFNYTIDALEYYQNKFKDDEIIFIMGSDNLKDLKNWRRYVDLIKNFQFIVTLRNNDNIEELVEIAKDAKIEYVTSVGELSSTFIRNEIRKNNDVEKYLDDRVIKYIEDNNLYKQGEK